MENKQDRTAIVAVIAGGIALLLGLCMGALGGGLAGYLIGRQVEGNAPLKDAAPGLLPELPATPEIPGLPELPAIPPGLLNTGGALVREVVAGSPAERAGLQVGDLITGVDDVPVDVDHSLVNVLSAFKPGDRVELAVWRIGRTLAVNVTLGENPDDKTRPYLGIRYVDISRQQPRPEPQD